MRPSEPPWRLALPPQALLDLVGGEGSTAESYLFIGYNISSAVRGILRLLARDARDFKSLLDFGCGCARVLRWFEDLAERSELHGTDISEEAIAWCSAQIPFARFALNDPKPPLPFPDSTFDLVYGVSVLTHLDEKLQFAWLGELQRITTPGGIVMLSSHGDLKANSDLSGRERDAFSADGFCFKKVYGDACVSGLPEFYQLAYHSRAYVEKIWAKFFTLRAYVRYGPFGLQDMVVMEKTPAGGRPPSADGAYAYLDLASGWVESPALGATVREPELVVSGLAFYPVGGPLALDIWIDGERVESCTPGLSRPDVVKIHPNIPSAHTGGFAVPVPIRSLADGRHTLSISAGTSLLPIATTYFFKG